LKGYLAIFKARSGRREILAVIIQRGSLTKSASAKEYSIENSPREVPRRSVAHRRTGGWMARK